MWAQASANTIADQGACRNPSHGGLAANRIDPTDQYPDDTILIVVVAVRFLTQPRWDPDTGVGRFCRGIAARGGAMKLYPSTTRVASVRVCDPSSNDDPLLQLVLHVEAS